MMKNNVGLVVKIF